MIISKEKYFETVGSGSINDHHSLSTLIELVLDYCDTNEQDHTDTIRNGLKLILKSGLFISSSLFLLDEKDYIFRHYQTIPYESKSDVLDAFAQMIEDGTIGTALETGNLTVYSSGYKDKDMCYFAIPLCNNDHVSGLVIIESRRYPEEFERGMINILKLMVNTFRIKLELSMLNTKHKKTNMYIEQLASEKALKILSKEIKDIKL